MSYELPNRSKPAQIQIMFHTKKPPQDFNGKTLQTRLTIFIHRKTHLILQKKSETLKSAKIFFFQSASCITCSKSTSSRPEVWVGAADIHSQLINQGEKVVILNVKKNLMC